jgi:hypothetical protein
MGKAEGKRERETESQREGGEGSGEGSQEKGRHLSGWTRPSRGLDEGALGRAEASRASASRRGCELGRGINAEYQPLRFRREAELSRASHGIMRCFQTLSLAALLVCLGTLFGAGSISLVSVSCNIPR